MTERFSFVIDGVRHSGLTFVESILKLTEGRYASVHEIAEVMYGKNYQYGYKLMISNTIHAMSVKRRMESKTFYGGYLENPVVRYRHG